jgi:hypothetical protein
MQEMTETIDVNRHGIRVDSHGASPSATCAEKVSCGPVLVAKMVTAFGSHRSFFVLQNTRSPMNEITNSPRSQAVFFIFFD